MIPLLRTAWIWTASAILILLWTPLLGVVRLFDREPRRLRTGRWFRKLGRVLAGVNPWRIHISGGENLHANQVYVVVSNHQSLADIPLISHLKLDTKWLAKAELFRVPLVGWMLRMAGDVPVGRYDGSKIEELRRCQVRLKAGRQKALQTNSARTMQAGLDVLQGRPVNHWKQYDALIDAVSLEDLTGFARRRLQQARRTQLVVRP